MVELLSGNGLQRANAVAESYDRALQQLIGPIFSCSELGGGVPRFGHDHRLGHSNLQESQLAKVDSDAKEGADRNDDHGP